jgi:hypothetical protein
MRYAMRYQILLLATVLASGLAAAETIAVDNGIAVKESEVAIPAVGRPPISRWEYPGFIVYFEHEHVIHAVVAS